MNILAFILLLLGLQFICLIIGRKFSKDLNNQEDYFLAGKNLKFFPLMMTFIATQVGGGLILGSAEEAYQFGWGVLFYPLGSAVGLLLLGLGLGRKLAKFKVSTIAQIFEVVYGSVKLKKLASVFSILSLFLILIAQITASSKFMVSLGVDSKLLFFAFWGIVIFYTSLGGLKAVVATDIVQAAFFIGAFIICFGFILYTSDITPLQVIEEGWKNESFQFSQSKLLGWLLMPLLFMVIEQDMGQRCLSADKPKTVSKATLCAGIVTFLVAIFPIYLGIFAKGMNLEVNPGASVLMTVIEKTSTPFLTALIGCAILVAIISTADSLLNAISSNVAQDFDFVKKDPIAFSQKITFVVSVLAIACSYYFNNILDLLVLSYELSVCCLFVPIFAALFKEKGNVQAASLAIILGATGFIGTRLVPIEFPKEIFCLLLSGLGYGIGELWVRQVWIAKEKKAYE